MDLYALGARAHEGRLRPVRSRSASRDRALLLAGVWLAYAASATLGAFAEHHFHLWALAVPLAALPAVIAAETAQPLRR